MIVSLNRVDVLSSLIGNTTEYENGFLRERARWVIMSTNIKIWHLKPEIDIRVVHFSFHLRLVFFLSWASDNNELLSEPTCWVTMSWMLHWVSLDHRVVLIHLDFKKIVKRALVFLVITTTNKVELTIWPITALKVMWELWLVLDFDWAALLKIEINFENDFWIFLKHMDHAARGPCLIVIAVSNHHWLVIRFCLSGRDLGCDLTLLAYCSRHLVSSEVHICWWLFFLTNVSLVAETFLSVSFQLLEWIHLFASVWALKHQILENLAHDLILRIKNGNRVTSCTLKFVLVGISLFRSSSEISDARSATSLHALGALNHIFLDGHTKGALNIFHESI